MTLLLSESDYNELCQLSPEFERFEGQARQPVDNYETNCRLPTYLGHGHTRRFELSSGIWLDLIDKEFTQPWALKMPAHEHLVQFTILLSGAVDYDETYPTLGAKMGYFSGSGISPGYVARYGRLRHFQGINVHLQPQVLEPFLAGQSPSLGQALLKTDEWKTAWFPVITAEMRTVAQQMFQCPFHGVTRRIFLQAKVFELLSLQLDGIMADQGMVNSPTTLKPATVERIYEARARLMAQLETPSSVLELAQQVGLCDRTLRRGFRELFGTSVIGYLTQQRLYQAKELLRQGNYTVAEVANSVGYTHLGHFSAAFRKQFGISPKQWMLSK
ncbi:MULTISPECIES: AraC family transcriptional regulator [unclassified Synechocystis]|uniref:helix-turn-helix transcriptional regulator n=1 Tax=unclassified Synechocystis TaxID=2640012 RepID=UPI0004025C30|nr:MULTISPECIES: AraC family transcriptional regulator [unclassified Synechocystis]AIE73439.1 Transcriptional regulator PchR [Synechocystis sp. PCC 6714]MCT0254202.1 AraC family transcriptional regulator [Synechocystis sp. CS-94]